MNITPIKKDDVFFIKVPIDSMPVVKAQSYMGKIRDTFKEVFDNDVLVIPIKDSDEYNFEILRRE